MASAADFPYLEEAIEKSRARTAQTRATTEGVQPGSRPTPTSVQDATRPRGFVQRAKARLNPNVTEAGAKRLVSGAGRNLLRAGKAAVLPVAAMAAAQTREAGAVDKYAERFGTSAPAYDGSFKDAMKYTGLVAGGFASDMGNIMTGGAAGKHYRDQPGAEPESAEQPDAAAQPDRRGRQRRGPIDAEAATTVDPGAAQTDVAGQASPDVNQAGQQEPVTIDGDTGQEVMGEVDLGRMLDDPSYTPASGTGIIRNQRTGRTDAVVGRETQPEQPAQPTETADQQQPRQRVDMPNMTLAMSARTMPQYLAQLTRAGQQVADNQQQAGQERGIVRRRREGLDERLSEQKLEQGDLELGQAQQLDEMLQEYLQLNNESDPDGSRRAELEQRLSAMRGGREPSDTPRDRYQRALAASLFGDLQTEEERAAARAEMEQMMEAYDARQRGTSSPAQPAADYTPEDLEFTAQQHGMTVEEVKQQLGIQ